jgi:3-oxoacid CoA-transferase
MQERGAPGGKRISLDQVAALVPSGSRVMVGGFGLVGAPMNVLEALARSAVRDLTTIGNNLGEPGLGLGQLLLNGQVRHAVGSYFTSNPEAVRRVQEGSLTVEVIPQGTLAEALRAGGAGLGGFFTPTAAGTALAAGREERVIDGVTFVFQPGLRADVALIKAHRADELGNLTYRMTARNFNPMMATAADRVIAEVEEIVPVGALDPEQIVTPHLFVDHLVVAQTRVEQLGTSGEIGSYEPSSAAELRIARRTRRELQPGMVVNLGIGIPTLVADLIGPRDGIAIHSENGLLGVGPPPLSGGALEYPTDAGKRPVTALPGHSYFDSAASFAMIRGGHVDVAVLGALQVDQQGTLANWSVPGRPLLGVGGAMDLARGARRVIATMLHTTRQGQPKLVPACSLPITAPRCVDTLVTELALFRFRDGRAVLEEIAPGSTLDEVRSRTSAEFEVSRELRAMDSGD